MDLASKIILCKFAIFFSQTRCLLNKVGERCFFFVPFLFRKNYDYQFADTACLSAFLV